MKGVRISMMHNAVRRVWGWLVITVLLLPIMALPSSAQSPAVPPGQGLLQPPLTVAWTAPLERRSEVSLAVGDGRIFVGSHSPGGSVQAMDLATGTPVWQREFGGDDSPGLAYQDGLLLVSEPYDYTRNTPLSVHALRAATGETAWSYTLAPGQTPRRPLAGPGGRLYIPAGRGQLIALNLRGEKLWEQSMEGAVTAGRDLVYAESFGQIAAFDAATGKQRWTWKCPCEVSSAGMRLSEAGGFLLAGRPDSQAPMLFALDLATGEVRWKLDLAAESPPVMLDGVAYLLRSWEGVIARIRLADGQLLEPIHVSGAGGSPNLIMADGLLYLGGIMAVDPLSGQTVWRRDAVPALQVDGGDHLLLQEWDKLTVLAPETPQPAGVVTGLVRAAGSGAPVAGARVLLDGLAQRTVTDTAGRFVLRGPAGQQTLVIRAGGFSEGRLSTTLTMGQPREVTLDLLPSPDSALAIQVVDGDLGVPVPGARLSLPENPAVLPVMTDGAGAAQLSLPAGRYKVQAEAPHYQPATVELSSPEGGVIRLKPYLSRPDDWTGLAGGPEQRSQNESGLTMPLKHDWSLPGHKVKKETRPIVGDGRAFVLTDENQLLGVDLATGKLLWSQPNYSRVTPAYDRGLLYTVGRNELAAHDAATGELRWSYPLADFASAISPPTARDGRVYLGMSEMARPRLLVLDGQSGRLLWSFRPVGPMRAGYSSPTVAGNRVYMAGSYPHLYAFDAATGEPLWTATDCPCDSGSTEAIVAADGLLLYTQPVGEILTARDAETGAIRWQGKGFQGIPVVVGDRVYVSNTKGQTEALRLADGQPLGRFEVEGRLAAAGNYLLGDGLTTVDLETGQVAGTFWPGGTNAVVAEDRALVIGPDRWLIALRPATPPPPTGDLHGLVVSIDGSRLMAEVQVGDRTVTSSPADGSFALRLPPGTYTLTARAPHFAEATATVTVQAGQPTRSPLVLTPEPKTPITGKVTSTATGRPLPGARLSAGPGVYTYAAADGTYSLPLYPGSHTLRVEADGYRTRYLPAQVSAAQTALDVTLEPGRTGDWPGNPPFEEVWSHPEVYSDPRPAVGRGMLFGVDLDGQITATDLLTGRRLWKVQAQWGWPIDPIGYGGGLLFTGDGRGRLAALDPDTGRLVWETPLSERSRMNAAPVYHEGRVYAGNDGQVFALDARTGSVLWKSHSPVGNVEALAVGNGQVAVGGTWGLVALEAATGKERWNPHSHGNYGGPLLAGGLIISGTESGVTAIDAATGSSRWQGKGYPFAVQAGVVYTLEKQTVRALDLSTGQERWWLELEERPDRPVVAGDLLWLGGKAAIDLNSRKEVWRNPKGQWESTVMATDGFLVIMGRLGPTTVLRGTP